jgi:hypothetical protein
VDARPTYLPASRRQISELPRKGYSSRCFTATHTTTAG